ncbi:MAG: hypothetical protein VB031_06910 [Eubacteriaceae bacterium]|nr:hypothetical protein [Eubacteriaceae bacterium]
MMKGRLCRGLCNKKGETLIVVVIIAVILLIAGTAVLGFAANGLHSTSKDAQSRGVYYVSKSAGSVITDSMKGGKLGQFLRDRAESDFLAGCSASAGQEYSKAGCVVSASVELDESRLDDYTVADVEIQYDFNGTVTAVSSGAITGNSLSLTNITVKYTVEDKNDDHYDLKIHYSYTGWYTGSGLTKNWSNEIWNLEKSEN